MRFVLGALAVLGSFIALAKRSPASQGDHGKVPAPSTPPTPPTPPPAPPTPPPAPPPPMTTPTPLLLGESLVPPVTEPPSPFWTQIWNLKGVARDRAIINWVVMRGAPLPAYIVLVSRDDHGNEAHIPIHGDALRIEGGRPPLSYAGAEALSIATGHYTLTSYLGGLLSAQAPRISPVNMTANSSMGDTPTCLRASRAIDLVRDKAGLGPSSALDNAGKLWVLTRRMFEGGMTTPGPGFKPIPYDEAAANLGFWLRPFRPVQRTAYAHGVFHTDYSQTYRAIGPECWLFTAGEPVATIPTAELMTSPEWGHLICGEKGRLYGQVVGEGHLPSARHPKAFELFEQA